ncbi:hypothetical protein MCOR33_000821 [Pyricularia grisea]|uniref:Uncharacterized protein n=1 Tax=Pyricularia grisea TaxID=148305 RepID=A0ABQ8P039_PYRGI|nr:hypothetical protein MCOR33_000821 [Pyricularia grisea]
MLFLKTLLLLPPVACLAEMTTEFPPTRVEEPAADCSNSGTCASHPSFSKQLEEYRVVGWNLTVYQHMEDLLCPNWPGSLALLNYPTPTASVSREGQRSRSGVVLLHVATFTPIASNFVGSFILPLDHSICPA